MVDKKELRVGNYIKINGIYRAKIIEINDSTLTIEWFNIVNITKVINIEEASFIHLDELLITHFGFKRSRLIKEEEAYSKIQLNGFELYNDALLFEKDIDEYKKAMIILYNGTFHYVVFVSENDNIYLEYTNYITKNIFYLHDLQNFHFAFTRKELD